MRNEQTEVNTSDAKKYKPQPVQEGKGEELSKLKITDKDLLAKSTPWLKMGEKYRQDNINTYKKNKSYYVGTQLKRNKQVTDNRTFLSGETIVPIATASPPIPNVLPSFNTQESFTLARAWEKVLMDIYKKQKLQKKLEKAVRYIVSINWVCMKYRFNADKFKIETKVIHPNRLLFDNEQEIGDMPWVGELVTESASKMIKKFPKKEKMIKDIVDGKTGTEITYTEFWTDEIVFWRYKNKILDKKRNPNFDYEDETKNFFDRPQMPYKFTNLIDFGETVTGETSLVDQVKDLQDGVNKRKSQIDKNAAIVNGKVIGTGQNGLKKKEFAGIDWNNSEEGIFMADGETNDIRRESGAPLPQFVENDMLDSRNEIDNIMGTHSTTRGEREGRETLGGRQLLRESDRGRIDILGRRLEELLIEMFEGWTQLVKVFYTAKQTVRILNKDGSKEFVEFDQNSIEDGMEIVIIPGTLIPDDKASRMSRAQLLANAGMIDPISLYREFGFKQPEEMAQRLYLWQNDPVQLFPELQQQAAASGDQQTEANIRQAEDENERMLAGEQVPPYEEADANHVTVHQTLMESDEFAETAEEVQTIFIEHVRGETEIIEQQTKDQT